MTTSEHAPAHAHPTLSTLLRAARSGSIGVSRLIWRALTSVEGGGRPTNSLFTP